MALITSDCAPLQSQAAGKEVNMQQCQAWFKQAEWTFPQVRVRTASQSEMIGAV